MTGATPSRDTGAFDAPALRPLRPWAEAFAAMPDDQTRVIGGFLAALLPLVETADEARREGLSELDSFDDLVAAGPLDRLITSELMWLGAMPAEFIRRLGEGEALRRRAVYRDLTDDRAIVALIDSGPEMLGRRRLAAIGALLALGVAARRRGARLIWSATGFSRAPLWLEGLDRRGLSRFVHQTGYESLTPAVYEDRLAQAPDPAALESGDFWVVTHGGWAPPDPAPTHRVEIDEIWPRDLPTAAATPEPFPMDDDPFGPPDAVPTLSSEVLRPAGARASVISETGLRQTAEIPYPDEALCAATLRAPFRQHRAGAQEGNIESWAPRWIAQEADLGSFYARIGDEIVIRQSASRALRVRLPPEAHLLGVRSAGGGRCFVVWREDDVVVLAKAGRGDDRAQHRRGRLAPDSPLRTQSHPEDSVPPAFRFGRKGAVVVAAPDGSLHEVVELDEGTTDGLLVAPLATAEGLRLRARAQNRLLCEEAEPASGALLLVKPRDGRRLPIWLGPEGEVAAPIRSCLAIGDSGGAVIADAQGVRWAPPRWALDGASVRDLPQPPAPVDAFLLRVEPMAHQSAISQSAFAERAWALWFWSREGGVKRIQYSNSVWRTFETTPADPGGEVRAMTMAGKTLYAMIETGTEGVHLVEFRRGDAGARLESATQPWYAEAACVAL